MIKHAFVVVAGVLAGMTVATEALADGGFQAHFSDCVERYASTDSAASVMLECNAEAGKLSACKVKENSAPGKGFDKAAICVAEYLPIGGKSGVIQVPVRFASGS